MGVLTKEQAIKLHREMWNWIAEAICRIIANLEENSNV